MKRLNLRFLFPIFTFVMILLLATTAQANPQTQTDLTPTPVPSATAPPSPTSTPPYPSPTPTYSPPVPSPTLAPSPTPPPQDDNNTPRILTRRLRSGYIHTRYTANLTAYDRDRGDQLTFSVDNLPAGITLNSCRQLNYRLLGRVLRCKISGAPTESGSFTVTATVKIRGYR